MEYAEKLKDPRWQKKRLKILERDQFTCRICGDDKNTLHIHHTRYNGEPWETDDFYLLTVCDSCHRDLEPIKRMNEDARIAKLQNARHLYEILKDEAKKFLSIKNFVNDVKE